MKLWLELWDDRNAMIVCLGYPQMLLGDEINFWIEKWKFWKCLRMHLGRFLRDLGYVQTCFQYDLGDVGLHLYESFERKPGWRFTARHTYPSYDNQAPKWSSTFHENWGRKLIFENNLYENLIKMSGKGDLKYNKALIGAMRW